MAVKQVIQIGDPRLKAENKRIEDFHSQEIKSVLEDLKETMRENELVGIAAPQLGLNFKVFVTEIRDTKSRKVATPDLLRFYINPKLINQSKEEVIIYEGCGSVVHGQLFGPVKRPKLITIEAFNQDGNKFRLTCDGLLARVILHEYDHLHGIEFTEKVYDYKKLVNDQFYREHIRTSKEQIESSTITIIHEEPI